MAIPIDIDIDNPDPADCPTTFSETVALLRQLIHGEFVGSFLPYVTGAATPGVDDQNKIWHRVDATGRPLGTYVFYSGAWRRQYSGNLNEVVMYAGDPNVDFAGGSGLGTVGGEWDGWALCNGNNGTPNLSDRFIVGAKMDDLGTGYPTGGPWKSTVSGSAEQIGGVKDITLTEDTTFRPSIAGLRVGLHEATGNAPAAGGPLYGSNLTFPLQLIPADAGNATPDAIPTLPPYYALAYVQFRGYA